MADLPVHHPVKRDVTTAPSEPPTTNTWADISSTIYRPCEPRMSGRNLEIPQGCGVHPGTSLSLESLFHPQTPPVETPQPHPHPHPHPHPKGPSPTEGDTSQPGMHSHQKGHQGQHGDTSPSTPGTPKGSETTSPNTGMTNKGAPTEGTVSAAPAAAKAANKGESATATSHGFGKGGMGEGMGHGGMGHGGHGGGR